MKARKRRPKAKTVDPKLALLSRIGAVVGLALRDRLTVGPFAAPFDLRPEDRQDFGTLIADALVKDGWELRIPPDAGVAGSLARKAEA